MSQELSDRPMVSAVRMAVVTVGDRIGAETVSSFERAIDAFGHEVVRQGSSSPDPHDVQRLLREAIEDPTIHAITIMGGTGLGETDVTMETVEPFVEKPIPGFGEAMRAMCRGRSETDGLLCRGEAFVSEKKVVFCVPNSDEAMVVIVGELIGRVLERAVREARG